MITVDLINNIGLLVALSVLYQLLIGHKGKILVFSGILSGLLFGSVGILGMLTPLHLMPGIIFDGRSIILSVAGLFGGPITAFIAGSMCAAYRLWLGGGGTLMGVSVITESAALGVLFYYLRKRNPRIMSFFPLFGFGLLVHIIMILMMLLLPSGTRLETMRLMTMPVLLIYPIATVVVCQLFADQEERIYTIHALRENEQIFNTFLEKSPIYVFFKDENIRSIRLSSNYENMLGKPVNELIGRSMYELFPSELAKSMVADDKRILEEGKQITVEEEFNGRHYSTVKFPIHLSGKPCYLAGFTIDITDRKHAEQEKERIQMQLIQSQKMDAVGRLAGGVAHDFNNMLTVIIGQTELMHADIGNDNPLSENLQEITRAAQHSAELTQQLLAFARKQMVHPMVVNINDVINKMLKMLHRLIGENILLRWTPDENPWNIMIDPVQLDQILVNMVVNARDAIKDHGIIIIETKNTEFDALYCKIHPEVTPGSYVMLAISDDGCGMNKEDISKIYEPFYTTKHQHAGTGLGLATVYGIVKQNDGFINVYSEIGEGSTFRIYLPRTLNNVRQAENIPGQIIISGNETIMIVEDEEAILSLGKRALQRHGYNVITANSSIEAINTAKQYTGDIHLILTDVILPDMNGRDLLIQLNKIHPEAKNLFMSGYTAEIIAHQGIVEEGINFIPKPFNMSELAIKVREVLDTK